MKILTKEDFENLVIKEVGVALINFEADWCAPCKLQSPIIEKIASDYREKVFVGVVNVDENAPLADNFEIRTLPTMIFFLKGEPIETLIGFQQEEYIRYYLDQLTVEQVPEK